MILRNDVLQREQCLLPELEFCLHEMLLYMALFLYGFHAQWVSPGHFGEVESKETQGVRTRIRMQSR